MRSRPLRPSELDAYQTLTHRPLLQRIRLHRVPWLGPGTAGMTIGRHILLLELPDQPTELVAHEIVHVRQWDAHGPWFLLFYVWAYLTGLRVLRSHRAAYLAIPFEQQARANAAEWAGRHG